jgi:uncharacterized membrane protein YhaH (DUF805 family)
MQPSYGEFLFSATGRISRSQLWLKWILPYFIVTIVVYVVLFALFEPMTAVVIVYIYLFITLWPALVTYIKRAHDRGRSGWFILLFLVPIVSLWPMVELLFLPGTAGSNDYGPDPLGVA